MTSAVDREIYTKRSKKHLNLLISANLGAKNNWRPEQPNLVHF